MLEFVDGLPYLDDPTCHWSKTSMSSRRDKDLKLCLDIDYACKGLGVFIYPEQVSETGKPYEMLVIVEPPLQVSMLPEAVRPMVASVQFSELSFERVDELRVEDYFQCF